jgi:hypothetical protein
MFFLSRLKIGHCFSAQFCFCALTKLRPSFKIIFQYDGNVLSTLNLVSVRLHTICYKLYVLYPTFNLVTLLQDCMLRICTVLKMLLQDN